MQRSDGGLFGPGSATWRIHRENALMLGGGRAVVLQVAHPLVAAGVSQHSRYLTDRWGRLTHTLATMRHLFYGDAATVQHAADRIARAHARVRGTVTSGSAAGKPYDATDPALFAWVWAVFVDTALLAYQRFVAPLPASEAERYYQEQKRWASACGVSASRLPDTLAGFNRYMDTAIATTVEPTEAAHAALAVALNPWDFPPRLARPALAIGRLPTVGLLPPSLRAALGLTWTERDERALRTLALASRTLRPLLPNRLRYVGAARRAWAAARAQPREP
jgi:uncharacterized protein (DUF2236 family)